MNRERHYLMLCTSFCFDLCQKKSGSKGKLRINIKADICHPSASCLLVLDRVQGKWNVPSSCASAQTASLKPSYTRLVSNTLCHSNFCPVARSHTFALLVRLARATPRPCLGYSRRCVPR